jgi:hypothetical protein
MEVKFLAELESFDPLMESDRNLAQSKNCSEKVYIRKIKDPNIQLIQVKVMRGTKVRSFGPKMFDARYLAWFGIRDLNR